ncbi:hypothetical protein BKI51_03685 [Alphaproteobacteria bacterium AO1-B]|nr:hypothetical protein BKI51_03685 [Alphaproteobacteria bacterium AO1-B]
MRMTACLVSFLLFVLPASATQIGADWSQLIDQNARTFEDPFKALTVSQLSDVATVARLRQRLNREELTEDEKTLILSRLELKETSLSKAGIDFDWLISQRWIVADKRKKAAWSVNGYLDGQTIIIKGYFLLAGSLSEKKLLTYLVPEIGMCAHVPPPAPNNLVRLALPEEMELPEKLFTPVEIVGTLRSAPDSITARVVDGPVKMASAWELSVDSMNVFERVSSEATGNWPVAMQASKHLRALNR